MMRRSIKFKLFGIICGIALAFVSMLAMLNVFFYDDYYLYERRRSLEEIYYNVNAQYDGMIETIQSQLEQLENTSGVRLSVMGASGQIKYDSIFREQRPMAGNFGTNFTVKLYDFPLSGITLTDENLTEIQRQGYTFITLEDEHGRAQQEQNGFLCLMGFINANQELLVARVPLAYVAQNSAFNLTFLVITALLTLGVCILLAYLASQQFTRPLIEIEEIAKSMADLDFSGHYSGPSHDEIGRLGQNINRLSAHLEQAVSALQNTNEELAREIEEKERIDSMRREFIVNVSHELKTPIALIQGYAEGLREGITASEADRDFYCDTIVDESHHMNHLVMQLLDLSKLEVGSETPELGDVDLYALCKTVADKSAVLALERGLSVDYEATRQTMWADYGMAEQVVTNFLSNAIRYTPEGGHITMSATCDADGAVRFAMENEGEPLDAHDLSMVFEKFYRTDKARSRESGGSGIGLSIVRAIAEAHGGACGAENVPGGVRFWFKAPSA